MDRIYQLTEEAVCLHAQLKSKTLTAEQRSTLKELLEETLALRDYLHAELIRHQLLTREWTAEELECPPEDQLMRGPVGAGGGFRHPQTE